MPAAVFLQRRRRGAVFEASALTSSTRLRLSGDECADLVGLHVQSASDVLLCFSGWGQQPFKRVVQHKSALPYPDRVELLLGDQLPDSSVPKPAEFTGHRDRNRDRPLTIRLHTWCSASIRGRIK